MQGEARRNWTRDETILALGLYFQLPFSVVNAHHPEVLKLAKLLHRPPASLSMKIGNLGRWDPTLAAQGIVGLRHGAKNEKEIWEEFANHYDVLAEECHRLMKQLGLQPSSPCDDECIKTPAGLDGVRLSRYRINQSFFRSSVLSAYEATCCVTGIADARLLIASHIKPWAKCVSGNERTDSRNGLCLSALFDRAFDKGLWTIDAEYHIVYSSSLRDCVTHEIWANQFAPYDNKPIRLPVRGVPAQEFISYHNEEVFLG